MSLKLPLLIFCFFSFMNAGFSEVITYPAPKCKILSKTYTVTVKEATSGWQDVSTYSAGVTDVINTKSISKNTSFAYFDCSGKVEVTVIANDIAIHSVLIRPANKRIIPQVRGNKIMFLMNVFDHISVEINGDIFHNLQLFANPLEKRHPDPQDTSIIYYGPGAHSIGKLLVASGKTVYIAGGAVVEGSIIIDHAAHVKIMGRGILTQLDAVSEKVAVNNSASAIKITRNDAISINYSKDVMVDGITVLPHKYSIIIGESKEVTVSNFKSFSSEGNADGIDIFSSSDVTLDHIFMRNSDDCIAIYGHRWGYYGNTQNITIKNSVLWADVAHPVLIGTHGDTVHPDTLQNIKFESIDILDQHENQLDYQGCLALNAGDSNLIRDVDFNNIQLENIRKGQLVNLRVMYNRKYNTSPGNGINNIHFRNLNCSGGILGTSIISGYDETRTIQNILFENLMIDGKLITDNMEGKPAYYKTSDMANVFVGEHVKNVKFISTGF